VKQWNDNFLEQTIKKNILRGEKIMAKYKVCYSGFAFVEADSKEEAEEIYDEGLSVYDEWAIDEVEEVDDFVVHF
jgi:hypothetical protein